jgi:endo-1,4-beta-xylanase
LAEGTLRNSFSNNFKIGAALSSFQVDRGDVSASLAQSQFNSITPEFQLKPDVIAPNEGEFDFSGADALVDWALSNGMDVRGHALLWHESTPDYFLQGTRDEIRARLENYITTVVEHFRGRVTVWDVVNEVISVDLFNGDQGIGPDRRSNWFEAVGNADYIDWAFLAARAADPDALLFINEYETENPQKQAWLLEVVQRLQDRGIPLDGVGHQMHLQPNTDIAAALGAIDAVDNQFFGLVNHVTELDLSAYQNPGSCWESGTNCEPDIGPNPPPELLATQARTMRQLFDGLRTRSSVTSVTTWGVIDSDNWLNFTPVERFNYPLLFDRAGEPKPSFFAITDENYVIE